MQPLLEQRCDCDLEIASLPSSLLKPAARTAAGTFEGFARKARAAAAAGADIVYKFCFALVGACVSLCACSDFDSADMGMNNATPSSIMEAPHTHTTHTHTTHTRTRRDR